MSNPLNGKHIVLGVTGGIAAYKSVMLLRLLIKAGAEVQVVMTPNATQFVTPVTFASLSGKPVVKDFFNANSGEWHSHVDLGLWADAMIIAPATASTIGKMANGVADNMLVTTYLSAKAQIFVAPAMDLDMMAHPSTVNNINKLKTYGNIIIDSESGELASHLVGKGRMAQPETIIETIEKHFAKQQDLTDQTILITAGPTHEPIDPVRFIGNHSTGKMGYAIARECAARGANVILVSGPTDLDIPANPRIKTIKVTTARQMLDACLEHFDRCHAAIMTAAVADYAPAQYNDKKIKREKDNLQTLQLVQNPDIASTLGHAKKPGQRVIGFALETDNEAQNAQSKMTRKNLDAIILNSLRDQGAGFGTDTNKITVYLKGQEPVSFPLKNKKEVASDIVNTTLIKSNLPQQ